MSDHLEFAIIAPTIHIIITMEFRRSPLARIGDELALQCKFVLRNVLRLKMALQTIYA